jgi:hypothetical protein
MQVTGSGEAVVYDSAKGVGKTTGNGEAEVYGIGVGGDMLETVVPQLSHAVRLPLLTETAK